MISNIDQDHSRFRKILKGRIKQNLKKYISTGELFGRKGKELISIPVPQIDLPRFKFGSRKAGGVGQGEGNEGDVLAPGEEGPGEGSGAGSEPGEHMIEVEVTIEELAEMLGEELELPRIDPKGRKNIETVRFKYTGIHTVGPESLRHFKRTFKEALKRQIMSGTYDQDRPVIIPTKKDRRYRSWRREIIPHTNAVVIYMMDVSGSMGDEQKEIVRIESFWIDAWLQSHYKGLETRYIIHDAAAREVDRETFFRTRESGGTMISSAYILCSAMIDAEYPPGEWNIYPFHFSDGDNWSQEDTNTCISLMKEKLLPASNLFCYGQVESAYGSGQFLKDLKGAFRDEGERLALSEVKGKDDIAGSIKEFLGKGK